MKLKSWIVAKIIKQTITRLVNSEYLRVYVKIANKKLKGIIAVLGSKHNRALTGSQTQLLGFPIKDTD